jgi:peptidyl-dipeptidase Dcp
MPADNPFLIPSDLPHHLPHFDRITVEDYLPAFTHGMAKQRAEAAAIASNPEPPTFDNTVVALERSGAVLRRVSAAFFNATSVDTGPQIQQIEAEVAPLLAAHRDAILLDGDLYTRVSALYDKRAALELDAESDWLLRRYHTDFIRAGARLPVSQQERLRRLNTELAGQCTALAARLMSDTAELAVSVDSRAELDGLSEDAIAAAAETARARGADGGYVLTLFPPTTQPVLSSLRNRALRERIYTASVSRGARGNEHDTTDLVRRITRARAERARLLGYEHHAAYVVDDNTARKVDAVRAVFTRLIPAAVARAEREAAALGALAAADGLDSPLQPWDWPYYAERVRRQRYDVDESELRSYFELDRVLHDGVFFAAGKLYGVRFEERHDLPAYHPDVRVFEVFDEPGRALGLFLADVYARPSKRGGAWMNSLVTASRLLGTSAVVVTSLNVPRPPAGEPTLLSFRAVNALFHEFGHALHALFSDVRYPKFAGTEVPTDFVEYPSQVNEAWMLRPEILSNYATRHRTGDSLPAAMLDRIRQSATFNTGFATTEYLAAAVLDLAWHTLPPEVVVDDVEKFEAAELARAGLAVPLVPPRYRTTYFGHIFASDEYSGAYYSYIWSEILAADTVAWFDEGGGPGRHNGELFRRALLAKGGSADAMELFHSFRGRDPQIEALLERRGLARDVPRGELERTLCGIWSEVLGRPVDDVTATLTDLGGDSIAAARLAARMRSRLGVRIDLATVLRCQSIERVARAIEPTQPRTTRLAEPPLTPLFRRDPLLMSHFQEWRFHADDRATVPMFTMVFAFDIRGPLRVGALREAIGELIHRHEPLRTNYEIVDGLPVQLIRPASDVDISAVDLRTVAEPGRMAEALRLVRTEAGRPFDRRKDAMFQPMLIRVADDGHLLMLRTDRIAVDGVSCRLLLDDLAALYASLVDGRTAPAGPGVLQFADWAGWQRSLLQGDRLDRLVAYWRRTLDGSRPLLELPLPAGLAAPEVRTHSGRSADLALDPQLSGELRRRAGDAGGTLFMYVLAVLAAFVARLTGRDEATVVGPFANRSRQELERLVGCFAHGVAYRTDLSGDPTFAETVLRVREVCLGAWEHQELPVSEVARHLRPASYLTLYDEFHVFFDVIRDEPRPPQLLGLDVHRLPVDAGVAHPSLAVLLGSRGGGLEITIRADGDRFDAAALGWVAHEFGEMISAAVRDPDQPLSRLPPSPDAVKRRFGTG